VIDLDDRQGHSIYGAGVVLRGKSGSYYSDRALFCVDSMICDQ